MRELDADVDGTEAAGAADVAGAGDADLAGAAEPTDADVVPVAAGAPDAAPVDNAAEEDEVEEDEVAGAAVAAGARGVPAVVPLSRMIAVSPRTIAAASSTLVPNRTEKRMSTHSRKV